MIAFLSMRSRTNNTRLLSALQSLKMISTLSPVINVVLLSKSTRGAPGMPLYEGCRLAFATPGTSELFFLDVAS